MNLTSAVLQVEIAERLTLAVDFINRKLYF